MPSLIEEHTQFEDDDGLPIVNGKVYIGTQNNDPKTNLITIYSDRGLTTMIANPQLTDSSGRTVNKIWVPGKYSIQVDDVNDVQKYQELDAGADEKTGIVQLDNVQGTNTITATGENTPVTALADNEQYNFRAANTNTGPVTLQIDLTTAKSIRKLHDQLLAQDDIKASQIISVVYNATDDWFELVSNVSQQSGKGADIASAAILPFQSEDYADVTGTTTITSLETSGSIGTIIKRHFDGILTLTHHATNLVLPGGVNITTAVGDEAEFIEYATGDWRLTNYEPVTPPGVHHFYAELNGNQAASIVPIPFDTRVVDPHGDYDAVTNYDYTPSRAGTYLVFFTGVMDTTLTTLGTCTVTLRKNAGIEKVTVGDLSGAVSLDASLSINHIVTMNGTTDSLDMDLVVSDARLIAAFRSSWGAVRISD